MPVLRACGPLESTKSRILQTPPKRESQIEPKKIHSLPQDYQHLEIRIRCSLVVGVKCLLDIMQTVLVAVCVHQLLVSRHAFFFLQHRLFLTRLGCGVIVVCAETCTCQS